jgi:hypothetical protein
MLTDGAEHKLPKPKVVVPFWASLLIARIFSLLSIVLGKSFRLPFWGFTVMEISKVNIFCSYFGSLDIFFF